MTEVERLERELEQLREREAMYRASAELAGRLVWSTDREGQLVALCQSYLHLTGLSEQDALDYGWLASVHPEDRPMVEARWKQALKTGKRYSIEFRAMTASGQYRLIATRAIPVFNEAGEVERWYGTSEDVQLAREMERARRLADERYRLASEASLDAMWDYDVTSGTISWSDVASSMFGFDVPLGTTSDGWWEDRIHPQDQARVIGTLREAFKGTARRWSAGYRFLRSDDTYADVEDRGFIIRDEEGTAVRAIGAITDLSQRKQAEAELRRLQSELIHVSRVSAMGTMASALAHELNQPLTSIANFVRGARRLLSREQVQSPGVDEALESAESSALWAGQIVRRLREFVARGRVSVDTQDLPKLIEEAGVIAFVDRRRSAVTHSFHFDPAARWIKADRIQIQQVVINLIRNAIEAMDSSPVREVRIVTQARDKDMVEVRVEDRGVGIAPELMDSLFSQFMTTKEQGMGIGLPISRTIVEAHGGRLWAENRTGGGAVFRFTLPAAQAPDEGSAPL